MIVVEPDKSSHVSVEQTLKDALGACAPSQVDPVAGDGGVVRLAVITMSGMITISIAMTYHVH